MLSGTCPTQPNEEEGMSSTQSIRLQLIGMRCVGCEHVIEDALRNIAGVTKVKASYSGTSLDVSFDNQRVKLSQLIAEIEDHGYRIGFGVDIQQKGEKARKWLVSALSTMMAATVLFGIMAFAMSLMPNIMARMNSSELGYGASLVLGFLTGFHCIGMCGAIIVSYSSVGEASPVKRFTKHLAYGSGKIISYGMIGAAFGALGAVFTITPQMRGIAAIFSGLYLILFGLQMTRVMSLKWMHWAFPTVLMRGVRWQLSVTPSPFRIGLLTGFLLGCGPLQAMYILAAGLGNPLQAGLYLALFSLGTLGPLLVFGTLASAVPRRVVDALVNASGLLVLLMGLMMLNKGLIFTGMGLDADSLLQRLGRNAEKTGSSLSMPPIIHMH